MLTAVAQPVSGVQNGICVSIESKSWFAPAMVGRKLPATVCVYHGNCPDGFTAAWVVRKKFGEVEFLPGFYEDPPPRIEGCDLILVDFCFTRALIERVVRTLPSLTILDHHVSAENEMAGFADWVRANNIQCQTRIVFDSNRSAAQIVWDQCFGPSARPLLVDYVADRDLWRFELPDSQELNAYISSQQYTFENWDRLEKLFREQSTREEMTQMGRAIEQKHRKDVAEMVAAMKRFMVIGGHRVPVANLPYSFASDAGKLMAEGFAFAACYYDTSVGRVFELRSNEDGLDVSEVARAYGGGGHRHAAGFRRPIGWDGDESA